MMKYSKKKKKETVSLLTNPPPLAISISYQFWNFYFFGNGGGLSRGKVMFSIIIDLSSN